MYQVLRYLVLCDASYRSSHATIKRKVFLTVYHSIWVSSMPFPLFIMFSINLCNLFIEHFFTFRQDIPFSTDQCVHVIKRDFSMISSVFPSCGPIFVPVFGKEQPFSLHPGKPSTLFQQYSACKQPRLNQCAGPTRRAVEIVQDQNLYFSRTELQNSIPHLGIEVIVGIQWFHST